MPGLPQRHSLVVQTAAIIRQEIAQANWRDWLPSERSLSDTLQVSRNTVRLALELLQRDDVIEARHGLGHRIVRVPREAAPADGVKTVALLCPVPLERLRPATALWIDELRALLIEEGCRLRVLHGQSFFRSNPGAALQRLVRQNPARCWVLTLSNEPVQAWFERNRVPCVVAGTVYPRIRLPFVDLDHRAMCRHAVGAMLALGHRRIAFLNEKLRRAGDLESEAGFTEGMARSGHPDVGPQVVYHESTVGQLCSVVRRLMEQQHRPTALLVSRSTNYLTVTSRLAQLGWRVPADVSVISRDEDTFLAHLVPAPAHYAVKSHLFAKKILRPVLEMVQEGAVSQRATLIMPDFIAGASLAAPFA